MTRNNNRATRRVLVVEDEFFVALDLESILLEAGKEVVGIAAEADEAVVLARRERPDLVLMDIRLAGGSDGTPPVSAAL